MSDSVLVEQRGAATWVTLNRPERRNAYDLEMAGAIVYALDASTASRAVVITGVRGRFCAGGRLGTSRSRT